MLMEAHDCGEVQTTCQHLLVLRWDKKKQKNNNKKQKMILKCNSGEMRDEGIGRASRTPIGYGQFDAMQLDIIYNGKDKDT